MSSFHPPPTLNRHLLRHLSSPLQRCDAVRRPRDDQRSVDVRSSNTDTTEDQSGRGSGGESAELHPAVPGPIRTTGTGTVRVRDI
ncbi:unnamed protein product [Pleuronectes platessa]|uniref:Uncharacterized protein n=1 Tax=Pleuronectes platessa TaxID=8262 RepID=A0A9N7Z934_PLEPL|nr:unnamed protein product [Pleuronectes platessa]